MMTREGSRDASAIPMGPHTATGSYLALPWDSAEARYREVYRMVIADGEVSREEERRRVKFAEELGLRPTRALDLREEIDEGDAA